MNNTEIRSILQTLGDRVPPKSRLVLVGGSALALLGSPRLTIDIDFIGDDLHPEPLHQTILKIAREPKIHAEPVPLDRFVPLKGHRFSGSQSNKRTRARAIGGNAGARERSWGQWIRTTTN